MKDYEVGEELYYVNHDDAVVVAIIEKIDKDFLWCEVRTTDGTFFKMSIRKDDNPWPVFPTLLKAIWYALDMAVHEVNDAADELAIAHVKKARLESLYTEQLGLGAMVEFEDSAGENL